MTSFPLCYGLWSQVQLVGFRHGSQWLGGREADLSVSEVSLVYIVSETLFQKEQQQQQQT